MRAWTVSRMRKEIINAIFHGFFATVQAVFLCLSIASDNALGAGISGFFLAYSLTVIAYQFKSMTDAIPVQRSERR